MKVGGLQAQLNSLPPDFVQQLSSAMDARFARIFPKVVAKALTKWPGGIRQNVASLFNEPTAIYIMHGVPGAHNLPVALIETRMCGFMDGHTMKRAKRLNKHWSHVLRYADHPNLALDSTKVSGALATWRVTNHNRRATFFALEHKVSIVHWRAWSGYLPMYSVVGKNVVRIKQVTPDYSYRWIKSRDFPMLEHLELPELYLFGRMYGHPARLVSLKVGKMNTRLQYTSFSNVNIPEREIEALQHCPTIRRLEVKDTFGGLLNVQELIRLVPQLEWVKVNGVVVYDANAVV